MDRPSVLLGKARQIYKAEGVVPLLRKVAAFLAYCMFEYRSYWLYAESIASYADLNEADFMPRIEGVTFYIISSNEEADELEAQGFPFRSQVANARRSLEKGATAFCIFVGQELASIAWHAPNRDAQRSLGEPPYPVDFEKDEICSGGAVEQSEVSATGAAQVQQNIEAPVPPR